MKCSPVLLSSLLYSATKKYIIGRERIILAQPCSGGRREATSPPGHRGEHGRAREEGERP